MMVPEKADVVVLGGGPAGSLAAGLLAKQGYDVVLLEKAQHPRNTVGESILPHFWRFMDMLGATPKIEEANFIQKSGGMVKWGDTLRRNRFADFGHKRPAIHANRDELDKIILDAAADCGAKVFQNHTALSVDLDGEEKTVTFMPLDRKTGEAGDKQTIKSKVLIDATGQTALVAKQFGFREFDPGLQFSALWGYFEGGDYLDGEATVQPFENRYSHKPVSFVEATGNWGWSWQLVLKDKVSVGLIMPREQTQNYRDRPGTREEKFEQLVRELPVTGQLLKDAEYQGEINAIRDYAYKPVRLSMDGCYLVGDAAAFVDPINSSGVTFGMYAAVLAVWAIDNSFKRPAKAEYYREAFEQQYRQRLEVFRLIALPEGIELTPSELDAVSKGFGFFSEQEKQLALTTTMMTHRPNKVCNVFERLDVKEGAIFTDMPMDNLPMLAKKAG